MKISFLVPTYNRPDFVKMQLDNILEITSKVGCDFEIVVGDNSTNEETKKIVESLANSNIVYFSNEGNVGYDRNIMNCFKHAEGDYIWLLGDKNHFYEKGLKEVLNYLADGPDALVFAEREDGLSKSFTDVSELLSDYGFRFSRLCNTILKKDCKKTLSLCEKYFDLHFQHIGIIFEYLCTLDSINVLWMPSNVCFYWKNNKIGWGSKVYTYFAQYWFKAIMMLPNRLTLDAKIKCLKGKNDKHHIFHPYAIIKHRCSRQIKYSIKDLKENREYLELTSHSTFNKNFWTLTLLPNWILYPVTYLPYLIYRKKKNSK